MPSTLIRVAVALLTFGFGVSATMFWIAYRTPDVKRFDDAPRCAHSPLALDEFPPLPPLPPVEEPPPPPRPPIIGTVLSGKAISKPMPAYPQMARAYGVAGTVNVLITVDESGRVISAEAVSGHPLLQEAAVKAARLARFSPTLIAGKSVKVDGTISYNFVLK